MKLKLVSRKIPKKELVVITKTLRAIQAEQSVITPAVVVQRAKLKSSPLHKYFQWDDNKAAEEYRLWQARELILSVHFVDTSQGGNQPIRAFVNVAPDEEDDDGFVAGRGYVFTPTIANKVGYQQQVLQYAHQQLIGWRNRYGSFREFFGVVKAIDALK